MSNVFTGLVAVGKIMGIVGGIAVGIGSLPEVKSNMDLLVDMRKKKDDNLIMDVEEAELEEN